MDLRLEKLSSEAMLDQVDISLTTDIIPVSGSHDITLRTGKKLLAKMGDRNNLDVFQLQQKKIIHPDVDDYSILNAYRKIRTHLLQKSGGSNFVLLVVSLAENMGSTFTAVNLAAAFAYEGEKTSLIIDCNLRNPKLHSIFDKEVTFENYIAAMIEEYKEFTPEYAEKESGVKAEMIMETARLIASNPKDS